MSAPSTPRSPGYYSDDEAGPSSAMPKSPCDYSDSEDDEGAQASQESEEEEEDERRQMSKARKQVILAWERMRDAAETDSHTVASPVGDWFVNCKVRNTYANRAFDLVVTRPRGVGGRYRTFKSLLQALDEAVASMA